MGMKEPQDGGGAHEEPKMELEADLKADGSFRKKRGARDKSQKQNKREREIPPERQEHKLKSQAHLSPPRDLANLAWVWPCVERGGGRGQESNKK